MKRTTMDDIAREVGVTKMTVSNVLNNKPRISKKTREKVLEAANRLNYTYNCVAGSLRLSRTKTIGLIISDSSFSFFPSVIKGIEDHAVRNGYTLLLCNTNGNYQKEKEKIELLISKRVDGIILAASTFTSEEDVAYLSELGIAFVYAIRIPITTNVDYVANDNFHGAYSMTDYLVKTGSNEIYFFNITSISTSAHQRLEGYRKALERHGVRYDENKVFRIDHTIEAGYLQMNNLLSQKVNIRAVFCGCDVIAIGVMQAALDSGYKIPDEIRIASYDDIEFAQYLQVPLTTVNQPKYDIGKKSVELLLRRIEKPNKNPEAIILSPTLSIRKST